MVKFDVVVGNPPYQDERSGTKIAASPIYHHFIDGAYAIGTKIILITPGRFLFDAGATPKAWNRKMLKDKHLKVISYYSESADIFNNIDIKGGVVITYRNNEVIGKEIGTFIPYRELDSVVSKIESSPMNVSMSSIAFTSKGYKMSDLFHTDNIDESETMINKRIVGSSYFERYPHIFKTTESKTDNKDIEILGRQGGERVSRWIDKSYIETVDNFEHWKVFLPNASGSGAFGEALGQIEIGRPKVGHTETFMSFGSFKSRHEAVSCLKYMKTKFARSLLGILKVTQNTPPKVWSKVPLQDFTKDSDIDWSKSIAEIDQQLYEKYGLSEEETTFIETHIKEME